MRRGTRGGITPDRVPDWMTVTRFLRNGEDDAIAGRVAQEWPGWGLRRCNSGRGRAIKDGVSFGI